MELVQWDKVRELVEEWDFADVAWDMVAVLAEVSDLGDLFLLKTR